MRLPHFCLLKPYTKTLSLDFERGVTMDDLYVISQGKYRFMRCAAIILPIVAVLLTTAFVSVISALIAD